MKKIFTFILAIVMVATLFTACGTKSTESQQTTVTNIDLHSIPGYTDLVYLDETGTVYYYRSSPGGYSWMAPYIINGHFMPTISENVKI